MRTSEIIQELQDLPFQKRIYVIEKVIQSIRKQETVNAMNIAADALINRDLIKDKSLTTSKPIPIKGGVFLHKSDISGDYNYVDEMAKKEY